MKKMRKTALFLAIMMVCTLFSAGKLGVQAGNVDEAVLDARNGVLQVIMGVKESGNDEVTELVSGSGFLIGSEDAGQYVITNYHVVDDAYIDRFATDHKMNERRLKADISVVALRDMTYSAEIVKYSKECDIAILKMENVLHNSTPLVLSSRENTQETQTVYALGFPAGAEYGQDVNKTKDEDVTAEKGAITKFSTIRGVNYIQHSAQLGVGNSGGPLVDEMGQVVGVNRASKKVNGDNANYYYSVQIDIVREMLDALGIQYSDVSGETADTDSEMSQEDDIFDEEVTDVPDMPETDKGGLESALSEAKSKDQADYSEESYKALDEAIANGQTVMEKNDATQEDVDSAMQTLNAAIDNLEEKSGFPLVALLIGAGLLIVLVIVVIMVASGKKKDKSDVKQSAPAAGPVVNPAGNAQTYDDNNRAVQMDSMPMDSMPFVGSGAGETSVLNEGAGETTILSNPGIPQASLFRISNRENIKLNKGNFTIGKERRRVDYCIDNNNSISRNHAMLVFKNGNFYLVDQKSTNGTYLNGVKLNPLQEMVLKNGDKIRLSDEEFEFKLF